MGIKQTVSHLMAGIVCFGIGFWLGQSESTAQSTNKTQQLEAKLEQVISEKEGLEKSLASIQSQDLTVQEVRSEKIASIESSGNDQAKKSPGPVGGFQKAMLENFASSARKIYQSMFTQMMMTDEEADAFVDEYVAYQSEIMDRQFEIMGAGMNPDDLSDDDKVALAKNMNDFREYMEDSLEERMRNHFGADYDQFDAYHESIGMRQKLQGFDKSFHDSLGDYAREETIRIMMEEEKLLSFPEQEFTFDAKERLKSQLEQMSQAKEWEENVLARTSAVLTTAEQEDLAVALEKGRKQQELILQMQELHVGESKEEE